MQAVLAKDLTDMTKPKEQNGEKTQRADPIRLTKDHIMTVENEYGYFVQMFFCDQYAKKAEQLKLQILEDQGIRERLESVIMKNLDSQKSVRHRLEVMDDMKRKNCVKINNAEYLALIKSLNTLVADHQKLASIMGRENS